MAEDQPTIISRTVVCQLLMLSRMRINQLVRDGWIKQLAGASTASWTRCRDIKFLRAALRRHTVVHAADSRVREARAREI